MSQGVKQTSDFAQYKNHVKLDTERFRARVQITSYSLCLRTVRVAPLLIETPLWLPETPHKVDGYVFQSQYSRLSAAPPHISIKHMNHTKTL